MPFAQIIHDTLVYVIKIKTSIPHFYIFKVKIIKIEIFWCQFKLRDLIANHNLKKRYFKGGTFEDDWPNFKMSMDKKNDEIPLLQQHQV